MLTGEINLTKYTISNKVHSRYYIHIDVEPRRNIEEQENRTVTRNSERIGMANKGNNKPTIHNILFEMWPTNTERAGTGKAL